MKVFDEDNIRVMEGRWTPLEVVKEIVEDGLQEDPFYVMDVGEVVARYHRWREMMPRVEPFYAVKCNDDKVLLTTLATLGTGFDCASKAEIQVITSLGVAPERIIFANPAKMSSHIRYASNVGVHTMTFDSETELLKMKHVMPHAQLVLRIRCDAETAQCPLGIKFGCDPVTEAPRLLKLAAVLGLQVVGISFHVGSGAGEVGVFRRAIKFSAALFAIARNAGHHYINLLDLGGGFPGHSGSDITEVSEVINQALETHFPDINNVRVIAEPGRYFAAAAYTLATMVYGKREVNKPPGATDTKRGDEEDHTMYFMNDGVYGSFNCVLYDHQVVTPELLFPVSAPTRSSSLWGPSCDGLDCVISAAHLPPLAVGSWLIFHDMGAYTLPVASPFNGFPVPKVHHVVSKELWSKMHGTWPITEPQYLPTAVQSPVLSPEPPSSLSQMSLSSDEEVVEDNLTLYVECAIK